MKYIFSFPHPFERFVSIEMIVDGPVSGDGFELQLPAWRPGRYELGNFAKNIRDFQITDSQGQSVGFQKITRDRWKVESASGPLRVKYSYFASQPDAGACWIDHDQMYINPIHCCFYIPGREMEKCHVSLNVPAEWKVATGMRKTGVHTFETDHFDQLVDSPFIASPGLQHAEYVVNDIPFHIWIQGDSNPDWIRIIRDFEQFTERQLKTMKEFPVSEYHFLVQLLPFTFYHGVEHTNSTVLALGPGYNLMKPALYSDFLGVASHELFHVWNVKTIRPAEMHPYNLTSENYAETGYVYEGVTTYYGDLFLARSGFFTLDELLAEYSVRLQKHMDNPGRFNYSVAQSSFDTWLDGYVPGIPGRKVSIYDEGCLIAWMLDFMIRSATDSKRSLDTVMQSLYFDFAKKGKGYTAADFRQLCEVAAERDFGSFFENFVYKAVSYENMLAEVISLAGLSVRVSPSDLSNERLLGLRADNRSNGTFVVSCYPGSPSHDAGLVRDDEIIAVDHIRVENNLSDLVAMKVNQQQPLRLTVATNKKIRDVFMKPGNGNWYGKYRLAAEESVTESQLRFRYSWLDK